MSLFYATDDVVFDYSLLGELRHATRSVQFNALKDAGVQRIEPLG
jgi:hypothetical protein